MQGLVRGLNKSRTSMLALMIGGALLAAGCSNSGSSGTTTTQAPTTTTTPSGSSSTTTTTQSNPAEGLLGKFQSGEHATFTASYKITSATSPGSTLTIAQQPPNSLFKITTSSSTTEFIQTSGKTYLCSEIVSKWSCYSEGASSPEAALVKLYEPQTYLPYFQAAARAAGGHATYSQKTVNGLSLSCIAVTGVTGEEGTATVCVTAQGILGLVSSTAGKGSSFEIQSYSGSVSGNAFVLPAKPTSLG